MHTGRVFGCIGRMVNFSRINMYLDDWLLRAVVRMSRSAGHRVYAGPVCFSASDSEFSIIKLPKSLVCAARLLSLDRIT